MIQYPRYPIELTKFKTDYYKPADHFTIPERWDNFTINIPNWKHVLNHFFDKKENLRFLELGTGNGLCSNFLLDTYNCYVDTVDVAEIKRYTENNTEYIVNTTENLRPFIDNNRCSFHIMDTKQFLNKNENFYDFIYVDASHEKDWVLHDIIKSFDFLKIDGLMILDDYGWGNCSVGVDAFLDCYDKHINVFYKQWQVFLNKLSNI